MKPRPKPKAKEVPKKGSSFGVKIDAIGTQKEPEDPSKKVKEAEAKSTLPPSEDEQGEKEKNDERISLGSDSEGDSEDGVLDSDISQVTPIKLARGKNSKKKQREEKTCLDVLQGCQKTLKGMMNTRSRCKHGQSPKGATTFQASK